MKRKVAFFFFGCWQQSRAYVGRFLSRGRPPPTDNQWERAFINGRRGLHAETAQSALTVILKLVIDGLISVFLIIITTVTLQFQS